MTDKIKRAKELKSFSEKLNKYINDYTGRHSPASEVTKEIYIIREIILANQLLFSKLLKKNEYINLTEIHNEINSYNGTIGIDKIGSLYLKKDKLKKDKSKVPLKLDIYCYDSYYYIRFKSDHNSDYEPKGIFADEPKEIFEKFCKNIEPIYNELIAGMTLDRSKL